MDFEFIEEHDVYAGQREYFPSLESALDNWGLLKGRVAATEEAKSVVSSLVELNGPAIEFYIPTKSRSYVAVRFENDPNRAGAWIHVGYVDHLEPLARADYFPERNFYRTKLSTWTEPGYKSNNGSKEQRQYCPNCGIELPLAGGCACQ